MATGEGKKSTRSTNKQGNPKEMEEETNAAAGRYAEQAADNGGRKGGGDSGVMKAILELTKEVRGLKAELKQDFTKFKDELKKELKTELDNMKASMEQKFLATTTEITAQSTRLSEAEQRVADLETVNTDLRDVLLHSLKQQDDLRDQLTSLEGYQKRNNIRLFGVGEEACEASSMIDFIDGYIKRELQLEEDMDLGIQRAHRSLGQKPQDNDPPRSIIINFQKYTMKERILRTAWTKKIKHGDRVVNFTHDLPVEVNKKLKEYKEIKQTLKKNNIGFNTPYPAKIRIKWDTGHCVYNNATEAAADMNKRGIAVATPRRPEADTPWEQRLNKSPHWKKTSSRNKGTAEKLERAREKLKVYSMFRRQQQEQVLPDEQAPDDMS